MRLLQVLHIAHDLHPVSKNVAVSGATAPKPPTNLCALMRVFVLAQMPQGGEPRVDSLNCDRHVKQMLAENSSVLASVRRILFGGGLENLRLSCSTPNRQAIFLGAGNYWCSSPPAKQVDANERGVPASQAGALLEPKGFRLESGIG